jgi:hypothetical protein
MGGIILDSTLGTEQDRTEGIPSGALANLNTPVLPGWILKIRASADIVREHHDPEKWTFSPEKKGGAVLATSKSNLGTYHLIAMPEALSLFLESSDKTYDLANLLQDEKIGPPLAAIAKEWLARLQSEQSLIAQLPAKATLPVSGIQDRESWLRSVGSRGLYLSYPLNDASIQISCARPSEDPCTYQVTIRVSPELPWKDVTKTIESSAVAHVAVTALIKKAR